MLEAQPDAVIEVFSVPTYQRQRLALPLALRAGLLTQLPQAMVDLSKCCAYLRRGFNDRVAHYPRQTCKLLGPGLGSMMQTSSMGAAR